MLSQVLPPPKEWVSISCRKDACGNSFLCSPSQAQWLVSSGWAVSYNEFPECSDTVTYHSTFSGHTLREMLDQYGVK